MNYVGNLIKKRTIELGLTRVALAKKVGVSEGAIRKWELHGLGNAAISNVKKLCEVLGLDIMNILELEKKHLFELSVDDLEDKTLGTRLSILRKSQNLRQGELAKRLGVSKTAVSMWEGNNRLPKPIYLQKICDYFNVEMDYLMGRSDTPNKYQEVLKHDIEENKRHSINPDMDLSMLDTHQLDKLETLIKSNNIMFFNGSIEDTEDNIRDVRNALTTAYIEILKKKGELE